MTPEHGASSRHEQGLCRGGSLGTGFASRSAW